MWRAPTPVVVCVDGSDAGLRAATWAVREAVNRDVPLRIVHVIEVRDVDAEKPEAYGDRLRLDTQYAESALREATAAVEATEIPVKLETEILWGPVESALIEESSHATMICLGTAEIACADGAPLSATAAAIARNAQCPVAIIGKQREPAAATPWVDPGRRRRPRGQRTGDRSGDGGGEIASSSDSCRRYPVPSFRRHPSRRYRATHRQVDAVLSRCRRSASGLTSWNTSSDHR